jgi:hypothetical protein
MAKDGSGNLRALNACELAVWSLSLAATLSAGCRPDGDTTPRSGDPNTSGGDGSANGTTGRDAAPEGGRLSDARDEQNHGIATGDAADASGDAVDASAADAVISKPGSRLDHFRVVMPCPPAGSHGRACIPGEPVTRQTHVLDFGGERGVLYDVRLRFCGVVDAKAYDGCKAGSVPPFCIDGVPSRRSSDPTRVSWTMEVDDPLHVYSLNESLSQAGTVAIDYSMTVPIRGGSRVTFSTASSYLKISANIAALACGAAVGLPQPYHGQFLEVLVESAVPAGDERANTD